MFCSPGVCRYFRQPLNSYLANCIVQNTGHNTVCLKVLEQIKSTFLIQVKFIYIHFSDLQFIVSLFSCSSFGFDCHVTVVAQIIEYWLYQLVRVEEASCYCCWRACVARPLPYSFHYLCASATVSCFITFFKWVLFLAFSGALSLLLPLPRIFYPGFSVTWFHVIYYRKP